jgi:hypothetical protein
MVTRFLGLGLTLTCFSSLHLRIQKISGFVTTLFPKVTDCQLPPSGMLFFCLPFLLFFFFCSDPSSVMYWYAFVQASPRNFIQIPSIVIFQISSASSSLFRKVQRETSSGSKEAERVHTRLEVEVEVMFLTLWNCLS